MPTHKVKGGYKWGKHGKIYPTKAQADKQGQAIYASGWKEDNNLKENTSYMKNKTIKLSESDFKNLVKESIIKVLKENYDDFDGYDNDLDYNNVYDEACQYLAQNNPKVQSWREIAMAIGFRLETVGPNDMETLKDAIQDAMMESNVIQEAMVDNYEELMPLYDLFKVGYTFNHYDRDEILTKPLYNKNGEEIGYSLKDLSFNFQY